MVREKEEFGDIDKQITSDDGSLEEIEREDEVIDETKTQEKRR